MGKKKTQKKTQSTKCTQNIGVDLGLIRTIGKHVYVIGSFNKRWALSHVFVITFCTIHRA